MWCRGTPAEAAPPHDIRRGRTKTTPQPARNRWCGAQHACKRAADPNILQQTCRPDCARSQDRQERCLSAVFSRHFLFFFAACATALLSGNSRVCIGAPDSRQYFAACGLFQSGLPTATSCERALPAAPAGQVPASGGSRSTVVAPPAAQGSLRRQRESKQNIAAW